MVKWKKHKLGDLVSFQRGHDLTVSNIIPGRFPVAGSNGIIGYHNSFTTKGPSLTLGRSGNSIGVAHFYENDFWAHNTTLYAKKFHNSHPKFIYYLLKSVDLSGHNSGSAVPSLNRNFISPFEVLAPEDLPTQNRIAKILSDLDDKIELNRRTNQTLEQMAQTLFDKYSETEETVPLSELIELNPKLALKKGSVCSYVEMKDLSESSASIEKSIPREFKSGSKFQNRDTLLARITPCLENGKTGFVDLLADEEIGWGSTEFIVMRAKGNLSPYFVYCLARDKAFRDHAVRSMAGTSGRQRVQVDMLETYELPKWREESINTFHSFAHDAFQKIKANSKETAILTKTRDTLLPKLMSGEIDVMQAPKAYEPVLS